MDSVDFLPERVKAQRARRKRFVRQGYLVAACAAALVGWGVCRQKNVAKAQAEFVLISERSEDMQRQLQLLADLQDQQAELMLKKRIGDELGSRAGALDVLAELERLLPTGIAIRAMKLEAVVVRAPVQPALRGVDSSRPRTAPGRGMPKDRQAKRVELELVGLAPTDVDVAEFIVRLSSSPLFEDVNMGYAKNTDLEDRCAREFKVSCYVVR